MKVLLTADWHLDRNNRLEDFSEAVNRIADYAIGHAIYQVCIIGDIYRDWVPSSVERMAFHSVLERMVANRIDVTIVMGNHDINDKEKNQYQHALSEFVGINNPRIRLVYKQPEVLNFGKYKVLAIPHLSNAYLKDLIGYKAAFIDALQCYAAGSTLDMVLAHALFFDAIDGPCNGEDPRGLALRDVLPHLHSPLFLGDIHGQRVLNQQPLVAYTGSPERVTFNEIDQPKGFIVYDLEAKTPEYVPLPARKFFQVTVDLTQREFTFKGVAGAGSMPLGDGDTTDTIVAILKAAADTIKDSVAKVVVTGHRKDLDLINRHAVITHLKECGPHKIAKISFDSNDDTIARDATFTGHLSASEAFKKWTEKQVYQDKRLGAAVYERGMELLNETGTTGS